MLASVEGRGLVLVVHAFNGWLVLNIFDRFTHDTGRIHRVFGFSHVLGGELDMFGAGAVDLCRVSCC